MCTQVWEPEVLGPPGAAFPGGHEPSHVDAENWFWRIVGAVHTLSSPFN